MKSILKQISASKGIKKSEAAANQDENNNPTTKENRRNFLKKTAKGGIKLGALLILPVENTIAQTTSEVSKTTAPSDLRITDLRYTMEESVRQYTHAWNQENPTSIKEALAQCWSEKSTYVDPQTSLAVGVNQLMEVIYNSYKRSPGRKFRLVSKPDCHHGSGRFKWELVMANQDVIEGMDYFEYNEKNQIIRIVGFFGPLL